MITLYKNLDTNQPVQFSSVDSLRKTILKNPFVYDGLAVFTSKEDDDALVNLRYVEVYKTWEVEEYPKYESSSYTLEEAVEVFIQSLCDLGIFQDVERQNKNSTYVLQLVLEDFYFNP